MSDTLPDPLRLRCAGASDLARAMAEGRERTLRLFDAVRAVLGEGLRIGYHATVNPPLWELGHLGWFEEFWIARNPERLRGSAARPEAPRAAPLLARADALYDSSAVPHARRWHLDLPGPAQTLSLLARGRERTLALLATATEDDDALYFFRLAQVHEAMHAEAAAMIAQTLGLDIGASLSRSAPAAVGARHTGEVEVPASTLAVGARGPGFAFDNELGPHTVGVPAFTIDRAPVTWAALLAFVDAGGYENASHWTTEGWAWRRRELPAGVPRHLSRAADGERPAGDAGGGGGGGGGGGWRRAAFGRWVDLDPREPAVHLSLHEARAWCRWAGRRLPTEHEWSAARVHAGAGFAWGEVWEWTASAFAPFPGFAPHPYRDYSQPWFDGRPVLKGGSFASASCMKHPAYRNFFDAGRNDVFAGFRSCAP